MTVEVHIENIFPTPVYISNIDVDNVNVDDIPCFKNGLDHISTLSETSTLLNDSRFKLIKEQIDDHMKHFYYRILGYAYDVYPEMSSSWLVRSLPGQESHWHKHANSIFSGVLYLKCDLNGGDISFRKDLEMILPLTPPIASANLYNTRQYSIDPKKGMLLLFESNMHHKVEKNHSNEERLSIAFNYYLKGTFRDQTAFLELR